MVAISGSRRIEVDVDAVLADLPDSWRSGPFIVGDCPTGVDLSFRRTGRMRAIYVAQWQELGRAAGPERNGRMIADADVLVALPCKESRGTEDAINKARGKGIPVLILPAEDYAI